MSVTDSHSHFASSPRHVPGIARSGNRANDAATNRWNSTPDFDNPVVGIDTIRVRGLHHGHDLSHSTQRMWTDHTTGEVRNMGWTHYDIVGVLGHKVYLQADERQGGGVSFELSVPKVLRRTNEVAASIHEVEDVIQMVFHAASHLVGWATDWTDCELRRVDLVRGFENVSDISATLNRLSFVQQSQGRVRKVFTDPRRGDAQTLTVGTPRRWMCTGYDKAAEMLWAASKTSNTMHALDLVQKAKILRAHGGLRVEISVRARPLIERLGSNRLVDLLQEDTMNVIAEHYFNAAGFNTPIGGTDAIIQAFREMSEDPKDRGVADRVLAMLFREANGLPQIASRNSVDLYRQVARRYHVTSAEFGQIDQPPVHLDWNRGIQVSGRTA